LDSQDKEVLWRERTNGERFQEKKMLADGLRGRGNQKLYGLNRTRGVEKGTGSIVRHGDVEAKGWKKDGNSWTNMGIAVRAPLKKKGG